MIYARIMGTGSYLPRQRLTNKDLEGKVNTTDVWIKERTGITSRHIAEQDETVASMGTLAAIEALKDAKLDAQDIDMVLVATCTPAQFFPSTACVIQKSIGAKLGPAFDIQAACSGFIYALSIADQFIRSGMVKRVLLVGSEIMSRVVDWTDRSTCILFGDGAGAVILEASLMPGILGTHLSADGSQADLLSLNNCIANAKGKDESLMSPYIQMQGNQTFRAAVNILKDMATQTLHDHNLDIKQLDWLVPHQANIRIIQATAEKLGLSMDKVIQTVEHHGNTSSASVPLALDSGIRGKKIIRGQTLLLEAFGGGLTWGSALIKY